MERRPKILGPNDPTNTASSHVRQTERLGDDAVVPAQPAPELPPGAHGNYDVKGEIARGGMGRIMEAHDLRHDRPVALKLLLRWDVASEKRFQREAWVTGRLQHPSIIPLYESGTWETGEPFFAMKLVRGQSLAHVLRTTTRHEDRMALLPHLMAVTEALAYAHGEGVVHRDLKPSNILVGAFGETVVIDWGLAKVHGVGEDTEWRAAPNASADAALTAEGHVLGTPHYMPPEQARGEPIDARADVYALGACMYHALGGALPYDAPTGRDVLKRLLAGPPRALREVASQVPPDLAAIVAKAMSRDPAERYPTANEMAEDLRRFNAGRLVAAHAYTLAELARRWVGKHRAVVLVASVAVLKRFSMVRHRRPFLSPAGRVNRVVHAPSVLGRSA